MTDSKPKQRRPTAATLYRHITEYMKATSLVKEDPISALLDDLKDSIVEEATRR